MSYKTSKDLRNLFIYQVFNRNHNETGTFNEFINDLDRIKDLGVDVVYLLPIHKIGQKKKKGKLGCPYSIQDYYSINPEYGTLDDFKNLIEEIHKRWHYCKFRTGAACFSLCQYFSNLARRYS